MSNPVNTTNNNNDTDQVSTIVQYQILDLMFSENLVKVVLDFYAPGECPDILYSAAKAAWYVPGKNLDSVYLVGKSLIITAPDFLELVDRELIGVVGPDAGPGIDFYGLTPKGKQVYDFYHIKPVLNTLHKI